jgi:hypothetical protein
VANKGLLFIPDISGFTKFVSETEIDHSRLIIQELLEIIINANHIGLEVSEVEGDAILFYKFGDSPDVEKLYKQVEKMFCDFHRSLIAYEYRRFCQCAACASAINLSLKVITHYGEFTGYNVKNFSKLIGKDVIVAHQLLKNDISQHEYWLVTRNVLQQDPPGLADWMKWDSSVKQTETGDIPFHYTQLSPLKSDLASEPLPQATLSNKAKQLSITMDYATDIITLFHATGDFTYRSQWLAGVKRVEEVNHFLPRVGMRCRCIFEKGEEVIYSSSYSFSPERIEFSETDENRKNTTYYTIEKIEDNKTRLTIDHYAPRNFFLGIIYNLFHKKKAASNLEQSMLSLKELVKAEERIYTRKK